MIGKGVEEPKMRIQFASVKLFERVAELNRREICVVVLIIELLRCMLEKVHKDLVGKKDGR